MRIRSIERSEYQVVEKAGDENASKVVGFHVDIDQSINWTIAIGNLGPRLARIGHATPFAQVWAIVDFLLAPVLVPVGTTNYIFKAEDNEDRLFWLEVQDEAGTWIRVDAISSGSDFGTSEMGNVGNLRWNEQSVSIGLIPQ